MNEKWEFILAIATYVLMSDEKEFNEFVEVVGEFLKKKEKEKKIEQLKKELEVLPPEELEEIINSLKAT
ncbi:hypothetical protein [Saccharolobus shibatae]|uniref:Uncharacterized protein n=1 Tax=Saccharolobus shibatae TaxID=2286 RepID=A0A8F5H0M0_9CREN|nr:hypothetical protein [Saccharolobus shibatae]QXJ36583.1 hypothetical protein J5U22_03160 [Saccharolobus shibatae]